MMFPSRKLWTDWEKKNTISDIEFHSSREVKDSNYPLVVVHMMYWNKDVDGHNESIYQAINAAKAEMEATDIVIGDVTSEVVDEKSQSAYKCFRPMYTLDKNISKYSFIIHSHCDYTLLMSVRTTSLQVQTYVFL